MKQSRKELVHRLSFILILFLVIRIFIEIFIHTPSGFIFCVLYFIFLIGIYGRVRVTLILLFLLGIADLIRYLISNYSIIVLILNLFLIILVILILCNDKKRR